MRVGGSKIKIKQRKWKRENKKNTKTRRKEMLQSLTDLIPPGLKMLTFTRV